MTKQQLVATMVTKLHEAISSIDETSAAYYKARLNAILGDKIVRRGVDALTSAVNVQDYYSSIEQALKDTIQSQEPMRELNNPVVNVLIDALKTLFTEQDVQVEQVENQVQTLHIRQPRFQKEKLHTSNKDESVQKPGTSFADTVKSKTPSQDHLDAKFPKIQVPPATMPKYIWEKNEQENIPVETDIVISIREDLHTKGLFHNMTEVLSCKYGKDCTFCKTLGEAMPITRCSQVCAHHKKNNGQFVPCHPSGWWPHIARSAYRNLSKIHIRDKDTGYVYHPDKGVRPNMVKQIGPIIKEVMQPTATFNFDALPSSTGLVTKKRARDSDSEVNMDRPDKSPYRPSSPVYNNGESSMDEA